MLATRTNNGHLRRLDPFRGLTRDMDWFLGDMPNQIGFRVDVRQEESDLVFEAEVPGLKRDQLDITVENHVLTITGEHKVENENEQKNYHLRERRYGKFTRSFRLPETADSEQVSANLTDGILTVRVPTREEAKARKIEVQ